MNYFTFVAYQNKNAAHANPKKTYTVFREVRMLQDNQH